jgi:hypothetical protein
MLFHCASCRLLTACIQVVALPGSVRRKLDLGTLGSLVVRVLMMRDHTTGTQLRKRKGFASEFEDEEEEHEDLPDENGD